MLIVLNNPAFTCGFFAITEKLLHLSERLVIILLLSGLENYFVRCSLSVKNVEGIVELVAAIVGQVFFALGQFSNSFINLGLLDFLIFYCSHHDSGALRICFSQENVYILIDLRFHPPSGLIGVPRDNFVETVGAESAVVDGELLLVEFSVHHGVEVPGLVKLWWQDLDVQGLGIVILESGEKLIVFFGKRLAHECEKLIFGIPVLFITIFHFILHIFGRAEPLNSRLMVNHTPEISGVQVSFGGPLISFIFCFFAISIIITLLENHDGTLNVLLLPDALPLVGLANYGVNDILVVGGAQR